MTDLAMGRSGAFDIGKVIERTFGVVGANFPTLFGLALVLAALPQAVAALALSPSAAGAPNLSPLWALGSLVAVVASFVLQAAVVHASVVDLNGGKASFGDSLRVGMSNFLPVLGISILMTIGIAFGMILLIVPGVMMAVAWSVAVPAQVVEKTGVFQSFSRSAELTRGSRWAIFGLFFVYLLLDLDQLGFARRHVREASAPVGRGDEIVCGLVLLAVGTGDGDGFFYESVESRA